MAPGASESPGRRPENGGTLLRKHDAARARDSGPLNWEPGSTEGLRTGLHLLSKVFMEATDSSVIVDRAGLIVELNRETERAYGWTRSELLGRPLLTIMAPEWKEMCVDRMMRCLRGEEIRNVESERWNKAGKRIPVLSTFSLLSDEKGQPEAIAVLAKDITPLRKVEADLKRNQQELRELSARLLTAAEEEGKRIARELHDSFGPRLARLNLKVSEVEGMLSSQPKLAEKLTEISKEIGEAAKASHDLSRLLHPAVLSQLGLEVALEAECATFSKLRGIAVSFSAQSVPETLPDAAALCLFRVAQESLHNIRKHSQAKAASVSLARRGPEVVMVVQDFGRGFDVDAVRGKGGLGLVSMEERVRLVSGSLRVSSKPGEGTRVEARVPAGGS